jgi:hypothetical protein
MDMPKKSAPPATAGRVDVHNALVRFSNSLNEFRAAVIRMGQFHGRLAVLSRERVVLRNATVLLSVLEPETLDDFRRLSAEFDDLSRDLADAGASAARASADLKGNAVVPPHAVDGVPGAEYREQVMANVHGLGRLTGVPDAAGRPRPPALSWFHGRPVEWGNRVEQLTERADRLVELTENLQATSPPAAELTQANVRPLSKFQLKVLLVMRDGNYVDDDHRITADAILGLIESESDVGSIKAPMADLVERGLLQSFRVKGGGYCPTALGATRARQI